MHNKFNINKYFCLGLITIVLLGTQIVAASDTMFQNNLLKMDVRKNSLGGVKVTLYTKKPYKDNVVVNKKSGNEYVILLPETASTMTSKPALNSTSDVLTGINVKTQQYGSNQEQKGYTKITIYANKPVEITPLVETLNVTQYKISEKEAQELLEQAEKKKVSTPAKSTPTATSKTTVQPVAKPAPTAKPITKTVSKPQEIQKTTQKKVTPPIQQPTKSVTQKIVQQPVQKPAVTQPTPSKQTSEQKIKESAEETETTSIDEESVVEEDSIVEETTVEPEKVELKVPDIEPPKYNPILMSIGEKFVENQTLNVLISLIPLISGLLILMVEKRRKKENIGRGIASKETSKTAQTPDPNQIINDDMNWKEKFMAYKNASSPTKLKDSPTEPSSVGDFENPFADSSIHWELEPEEEKALDIEELFEQKDLSEQEFSVSVENEWEDGLEEEEITLWEDFIGPEPIKESSIEDIFGDGEEELEEDYFEEEPLQFEEASAQVVEETEVFDTTSFEAPFEEPVKEPNIEPQPNKDVYETHKTYETKGAATQDFSFEKAYESLQEELQQEGPKETAEPYFEDHLLEKTAQKNSFPFSTKSSYQIDAIRSLHLVDLEESTALVGYVNEEMFLLKKFDEPTKGKMQVRLNEHTDNVATYLVKVNGFKALVEVVPEKMKILLEL